ncbi:polysaccharide pyruvyl transferase family protein [Ideonella sp.]|uniref:polysaccharide pyruvyl transferase family protein n=1 Tax=Ideonella sp. TaxID=1929293 RepID=UPI002B4A5F6C|nr:polysaccharide pyruvyl transferase family protein [Ideonella sp.]HJV71546.1 polysaccharide pyruvyl transferase family protein [Ideonella sp.]
MRAATVLFGAFDRHNFGDLLFPHIVSALLPGHDLVFAGLAERDLRPYGGHTVHALHRLAREGRLRGASLVHVGGEILSCSARQAAVMLLPNEEVDATLGYIEQHPGEEPHWLGTLLGTASPMPYVASRDELPGVGRVVFNAVGGVALPALPPPWRQAVLARLAAADAVGVRDVVTLASLQSAGIAASLMPDPAVMVDTLFGPTIRARAGQGPVAEVRAAFPGGYVAMQLAADFGDDATLATIGTQLEATAADTGLGIVLFRAGAAPCHDALGVLARIAQRMATGSRVRLFESLDLWDICALLAHASAHAGSSLHGHIVATAFGVPAVGLQRPHDPAQAGKLAAYLTTWEAPQDAVLWPAGRLAEGIRTALAGDAAQRQARRAQWVASYRSSFEQLMRC